jgi:hypothetical protein
MDYLTGSLIAGTLLLVVLLYVYREKVAAMFQREGFTDPMAPAPATWNPETDPGTREKINGQDYFDGSEAYAEGLKMGMDPAIIASHRQYVSDTDFLATTGASYAPTRDDFTPAVPWHGLPRKAHYAQTGSERSARVSQSETPEETIEYAHHHSIGYSL